MMWLKKGRATASPNGGFSNPYCYHIDQFECLRPIYMKVIEYARKMGLDMIQGDHEDAPGQIELNFNYDDALRTADRLTTYRQICSPGRARVQRHRLFHVQAVHGRFGERLSSQHFAVDAAAIDEFKPLGNDPNNLPGFEHNFMYRRGGNNTSCRTAAIRRCRARSASIVIGGIVKHRRRADRDRLLDRQLLSAALGHRFLGARLRRLGFSKSHLGLARLGARPLRIPRGRFDGEPVSDGGRHPQSVRGRHQEQDRSGQAGRAQHLRRPWKPASKSRSCR